jgi:hypothetical protein
MSKKLVAGVVIGIGLLVGLSVMLVAELKHKYDTPIETEVEESENELVMPFFTRYISVVSCFICSVVL